MRNLAAVLATGVCVVAMASPAQAQTENFRIPAGSLKSALDRFAKQSGRQVIYRTDDVRGVDSPGATGSMTADAALERILAGTGFAVRRDSSGALAIVRADPTAAAAGETTASTGEAIDPSRDDSGQIVVTGTRLPGGPEASPLIVVGRQEIERSGYATVGELMRSLPQSFSGGQQSTVVAARGSNNGSNLGFSDSANLRGLGSESTLVLVNGRRLPPSGLGSSVDISVIPLPAVKRIDILTDSASAIYGSDAVGGVVNFVLRDDYNGLQSGALVGGTSNGGAFEQRYHQLAGTSWSSGSAVASYQYSHVERLGAEQRDFTSSAAPFEDLVPRSRQHTFFVDVMQDVGDRTEVELRAIFSDKDLKAKYYFDPTQYVSTTSNTVYSLDGSLRHKLFADWEVSGSMIWNKSQVDYRTGDIATFPDSAIPTPGDNKTVETELALRGSLARLPGGPIGLAVGAGHRDERFSYYVDVRGKRNVDFAFGELNLPLIGRNNAVPGIARLVVTGAIRFEDYSDFGQATTPKVGISYYPVPDLKLRATWTKAFRAPTLYQLNSQRVVYQIPVFDPISDLYVPVLVPAGGNPDLSPERSRAYNVGFDYTPNWMSGLQVSANIFDISYRGRITDPLNPISAALSNPDFEVLLTRSPSPAEQAALLANADLFFDFIGVYDPAAVVAIADGRVLNIAAQKVRGLDIVANYAIPLAGGDLVLSANGAWMKLRQRLTSTGDLITLSGTVFNPPEFKARVGATWQDEHWSLSGYFNHVSSSIDDISVPARSVDSFDTVDVSLSRNFRTDSSMVDVRLSVQNLFNEDPPLVLSTFTNGIFFDSTNASALGRVIRLSATLDW